MENPDEYYVCTELTIINTCKKWVLYTNQNKGGDYESYFWLLNLTKDQYIELGTIVIGGAVAYALYVMFVSAIKNL